MLKIEDVTRFHEPNQLKTEFVATASHQLRTPLTSVAMSLDLLQESVAPALGSRDPLVFISQPEDYGGFPRLLLRAQA